MLEAKNLIYTEHNDIDMEIKHPTYGWIPFTASPNDNAAHGKALYAEAKVGNYGDIKAYQGNNKKVL